MNSVLVAARLGLAAIFLVAALAKLADMPGSRSALGGFNVPSSVIPAASIVLPALEFASAALLLVAPAAEVGAALASVLLLVFVGGIAAALRRGSQPDCHCFGQLHWRPVGKETIARNGVLAAVGLFVLVAGPGPELDSWIADSGGQVVALTAISLLAIGLAYVSQTLWRDNRDLRGRGAQSGPVPLEMGQLVPQFEAIDIVGSTVTSGDLLDGAERNVLVFTSATCGPCVGLLPELSRWRTMLEGRLDIHVVASGDEAVNRRLSEDHDMPMLLDRDSAVMRAFGVGATPSAFAIDGAGRILAPVAVGAPSIEGLIRVALKKPASTVGFDVHQVQPDRA